VAPLDLSTLIFKSFIGGLPLLPLGLPQRTIFFVFFTLGGVHLCAHLQDGDIGPKIINSYLRLPILAC